MMNPDLTETLYSAFPRLYRGRHKPPSESSMCWGFECGDGWYQILHDLSLTLSEYQFGHPAIHIEVMQVKSKLGILRIHLNYWDEAIEQMVKHAQQLACVTCEDTGILICKLSDS